LLLLWPLLLEPAGGLRLLHLLSWDWLLQDGRPPWLLLLLLRLLL
jgi:hypothetical protein